MQILIKKSSMLGVRISSYGCTRESGLSLREAFEWHEAKPSTY